MMLNKVSLNTIGLNRIGLNRIGKPSRASSDRPYIDPEVLASLKAVCICYGKSNDDPDRAIVKNLVDPDNPFVISNAAFKLNSGFGKYSADFESFDWAVNISQKQHNKATISLNGRLCNHTAIEIDEMKVNIIGNVTELIYWYIANPDDTTRSEIRLTSGINTLPKSYAKDDGQTYNIGFAYISGDSEITIEQIPSFEGAFVTDGIDDLITSTKTVQEMLGGSNEITVVSMIHQIDGNVNYTNGYTNYIRHGGGFIRNSVAGINGKGFNKTGIYGYTSTQLDSSNMGLGNVINNILGDKDDYSFERSSTYTLDDAKYSVQNFVNANNQPSNEGSSVAWYWTIIANKVLTTDQINQVIAYFNLDRTLKPDILCNTIKQGITNENHAEFGDKLIDFSGNGRDIQMYNLAWNGDSGIGDYEVDFTTWNANDGLTVSKNSFSIKSELSSNIIIQSKKNYKAPSFKIKIKGLPKGGAIQYRRADKSGSGYYQDFDSDGDYECLAGFDRGYSSFMVLGDKSLYVGVTVEQISSKIGALCLDGVNDFGKVTGMPIYKDYTFIIEREFLNETFPNQVCLVSKSKVASEIGNGGAFIVDNISVNSIINPYSFYKTTSLPGLNTFDRQIVFQSKYKYLDKDIAAGTATDSDTLWLGTFRDNDSRFANVAIYSLMSFPYSMSKFLIERQLKKHKLGTLYPNMVEFRPVIKANANYKITYYQIDSTNTWKSIKLGDYIVIGAKLAFQITFDNDASELKEVVSPQLSDIIVEKRPSNPGYNIYSYITSKSPQKINITIDEYIRFEDIVQPYPVLLRFNDENGNEVSWGGKFRVGSTITRIGNIADPESNLLNGLYSISGLSLNGKAVTSSTSIVEKQMVFKTTATYLLDNNEPKCILSPRLLRIPNSSYKILGYIPDISGHGNHGKINNSAYAGMSGANGYVENFNNWIVSKPPMTVEKEELQVHISYIGTSYKELPMFEYSGPINNNYSLTVDIQGIPDNVIGKFIHNNGFVQEVTNGTNTIKFSNSGSWYGFTFYREDNNIIGNCNITIEQIGEYEGAYCLDGVDDHITIPTVTGGGKQVLMKVNNNTINSMLYDQRSSGASPNSLNSDFAIYNTNTVDNNLIAYQSRLVGKTYIDGILNTNITCEDLLGVLHNITITCDIVVPNNGVVPNIGRGGVLKDLYSKVALYDFMLFDEISTDDKIKELNEYVGIEGNTDDLFNETN